MFLNHLFCRKQERLDFLYESGLAVGKGTSGFKALESLPKNDPENAAASSSAANSAAQQSVVPGALFEEKPQSANDAWRKLHSDPLLLIRRREQEALARVKNNPVQMAMIRKSVEAKKNDEEEKQRKKHRKKQSKHRKHSSSKSDSESEDTEFTETKRSKSYQKRKKYEESSQKEAQNSDDESSESDDRRKRYDKQYKEGQSGDHQDTKYSSGRKRSKGHYESQHQEYSSERRQVKSRYDNQNGHLDPKHDKSDDALKIKKSHHNYELKERVSEKHSGSHRDKQEHILERHYESHYEKQSLLKSSSQKPPRPDSNSRLRNSVKLSAEDRAARLREMQMDAEMHEEQRWKRLKKAAETDAQEALRDQASSGRNFLDTAQKNIYGAEKGGSSTIEESVRRRTHYSQGRSDTDKNAFRR